MGKWSVRKRANALLGLSAVGILAAFPFQHTFWGGFGFALFSAGTIGGLADSFAIGALYGDPLRIKWPRWMGTHIIARNRQRLIGELVDMVEKDLLTVASIRETLEEHDLGQVLAGYMTSGKGNEETRAIAQKLLAMLLAKADPEQLAAGLQRFIADHGQSLRLSDLLADIGEWSIRNRYDDKAISFILQPFVQLVKSASFKLVIEQVAQSAIRSYEGEKFRRRLVNYTGGLNAASISGKVQDWLSAFLQNLAEEGHPHREKLKAMIAEFVRRLRDDEELREQVERGKTKALEALKERARLDEFLRKQLGRFHAALTGPGSGGETVPGAGVFRWLDTELEHGLQKLNNDSQLQRSLDGGIKSLLLSWIEEKHAWIGRLVREKLESYSEAELISLVKEKAGRDLQYIRLNGMIVGSFAGVMLYLLTFWIRG
ncbi:DUF445 domain-containing protein [Paenibacillus soyae]|uniref:DUF445 domain-containing protein n=1 Tax=Paenibacillus soyae TaxID=2969249 RepID=A0A9X2MRB4_9BACL|nr:DUF445 domain-containing protein [Paenibacillus soyae]MCR2804842.1 DUF445 domain-containing protein [Paenibacillus soyae]